MSTFQVSASQAGKSLLAILRPRMAQAEARRLIEQGRVRVGQAVCRDPGRRLRRGQRIRIEDRAAGTPKAPPPSPSLPIRHKDAHVVVVDKPAGLTTMRHSEEAAEFGERGRRFLPATLLDLLAAQVARGGSGERSRVRAVHRLDKETSGLVVFALTREAEGHLGKQFRAHTVERYYIGLVRGKARSARIESNFVDDRGDGRRGSAQQAGAGKHAVTEVRVLEELGEFTLVECRLETGRTHQVRIHLGEAGTPLCGERIYDRPLHGKPYPDTSGANRPLLHAAGLGFLHPATSKPLAWTAPLPRDFRKILDQIRSRALLPRE